MSEIIVEKIGDVRIYGKGETGGKGSGLIKINEGSLPKVHKLSIRILSTSFYDRFFENDGSITEEDSEIIDSILKKFGDVPISVRSSATNEACFFPGGDNSVHAGENTSFMLPNNHPEFSVRSKQLKQAISYIYQDFKKKQPPDSKEKMAIMMNPIPGILKKTLTGTVYFPMISGVANSFFPYALKTQKSNEGVARLAFGHGYATVLDDFSVISMATIQNPIPLKYLGEGQKYFYAIDMTKNEDLEGNELETMKKLHLRFADPHILKLVGKQKNWITLEEIVQKDRFGFKSTLCSIMEKISSQISSHFQIEFVFNIEGSDNKEEEQGIFHIVQLTPLPKRNFAKIIVPKNNKKDYLKIKNFQGHGIKKGIRNAIVVSPFLYKKDKHDTVKKKLNELSERFKEKKEKYFIIVPGRLGSSNLDWGIQVEYKDIGCPEAIFEYGVDITGRPRPSQETLTGGGVYGSHFLYMIQGGYNEEQKRIQTRMFGTQGTHFLTNLMSNNTIYGYIAPLEDKIDPWFFSPPQLEESIYALRFPKPVTIYADSFNQNCTIIQT